MWQIPYLRLCGDRMETLRLPGYSEEEKLVIAERYLVPKQVEAAGLHGRKDISIGRPVLRRIISEYTREAGLRELERLVAQLSRKVARKVVEAQDAIEDATQAQTDVSPGGKSKSGKAAREDQRQIQGRNKVRGFE